MKKIIYPRLIKWMFLSALAFLVFMTFMRFVFFYHFAPLQYSFSNSLDAFILGLHFDLRMVCGIVLFPFIVGNLHLKYSGRGKLTTGSLIEMFFTIAIMTLLLLFMKKGHASVSTLVFISILFILILIWLFRTQNCNPFENALSRVIFKIYFFIIL